MKKVKISLVLLFGLVFLASLAATCFAEQKETQATSARKEKASAKDSQEKQASEKPAAKGPVYKPPQYGAPGGRVGGGTRGIENQSLMLIALVPNHKALTTVSQPTLYWYLSKPSSFPLEFAISEDKAVAPLGEKRLAMPEKGGIYDIPLKDFGIQLKENVMYRWFVALVPDSERRSKDILADGIVQRISVPEELPKKLASADTNQAYCAYAEAGVWYDALMTISQAIQANPANQELRQERRTLLQQVGLTEAIKEE